MKAQASTIGEVIRTKSASLYRENSRTVTSSSIELPAAIDDLIDNKMYRNKFRKLIREGHLRDLLELAKVAATKDRPSRWFAVVTSKARWQGTLAWLAKALKVAAAAAEVARRVGAKASDMKVVLKACWRSPDALRHAVTAAETGRNPLTYFCWLIWKAPPSGGERNLADA